MKKLLSIFLTLLTALQIGASAVPLTFTTNDNNSICIIRLLNDEMVIYVPHDQIKPFFKLLKTRNTCYETLRHPATIITSGVTAWGLQLAGSIAAGKAVSRMAEKTGTVSPTAASWAGCGVGILTYSLLTPLQYMVAAAPRKIANRLDDCLVSLDDLFIPSNARVVNSEFQRDAVGHTTLCDPEYLLSDLGIDNPVPGRDRWTDLGTGIIITVGGRDFDLYDNLGWGHHAHIYRVPAAEEVFRVAPPCVMGARDGDRILDTFFGDLDDDRLTFHLGDNRDRHHTKTVTEIRYTDQCDNDLYAQLCR